MGFTLTLPGIHRQVQINVMKWTLQNKHSDCWLYMELKLKKMLIIAIMWLQFPGGTNLSYLPFNQMLSSCQGNDKSWTCITYSYILNAMTSEPNGHFQEPYSAVKCSEVCSISWDEVTAGAFCSILGGWIQRAEGGGLYNIWAPLCWACYQTNTYRDTIQLIHAEREHIYKCM